MININPSDRPNPAFIFSDTAGRLKTVSEIALSAIGLFQPAFRTQAQLVIGSAALIHDISKKDVATVAYKVITIATSLFYAHLMEIGAHSVSAFTHATNSYKKRSATELLLAAHEIVFVAKLIRPTPELILITTLAQIAFELHKGYRELCSKHIEGIGFFILALARFYAEANPLASTVRRDWFGKELTQESLDTILESEKDKIDIEKILIEKDYSSTLKNLSFKAKKTEGISYKNICFKSCSFESLSSKDDSIENCRFDNSSFEDSNISNFTVSNSFFTKCSFANSIFNNTTVTATQFSDCNLTNTSMYLSTFQDCNFLDCILTRSSFFGSHLTRCLFDKCDLTETSFFKAIAESTVIKVCNLTDTIIAQNDFTLVDCAVKKTKPVIALGWYFNEPLVFGGMIYGSLIEQNATVLRIPKDNFPGLNKSEFSKEAAHVFEEIRSAGKTEMIATEFLKRGAHLPEINKLRTFGKEVAAVADGVVIPGGEDVHEEYYDISSQSLTDDDGATALELAVAYEALQANKMLAGICRGAQLLNVLHGGTLKDCAEPHFDQVHTFSPDQLQELPPAPLQELLSKSFPGLSMHHQQADKIGKGLHVLFTKDQAPELMCDETGKVLLMQFHPEAYSLYEHYKDWLDDTLKFKLSMGLIPAEKFQTIKSECHEKYKKFSESLSYGREFWRYIVSQANSSHTKNAVDVLAA